MFATTHVLASVVISQHAPTPWWAFFVSLISHYILDLLPHGDRPIDEWLQKGNYFKKGLTIMATDMLLIALIFFTFAQRMSLPPPPILAAAVIGGMLPDVLWIMYKLYDRYLKRFAFFRRILLFLPAVLDHHRRIHNYIDHSPINHKLSPTQIGVAVQFLFLTIFIILALYPK